ncbi:MAG TPA: hypothetical protein VM308_04805 [Sphingomicrobium sp.]|nr:hypothetical protein [Sphingomicrobium sp.]
MTSKAEARQAPPLLNLKEFEMADAPTPRILLPSLIAGPGVLLFFIIAGWSATFTSPIVVGLEELVAIVMLVPLTAAVGFGPALVANAIGSFVMIWVGRWFPLLRFPLVWGLAGGVLAWVVAAHLEFGPEWVFAFTATGAVCALACRMRLA